MLNNELLEFQQKKLQFPSSDVLGALDPKIIDMLLILIRLLFNCVLLVWTFYTVWWEHCVLKILSGKFVTDNMALEKQNFLEFSVENSVLRIPGWFFMCHKNKTWKVKISIKQLVLNDMFSTDPTLFFKISIWVIIQVYQLWQHYYTIWLMSLHFAISSSIWKWSYCNLYKTIFPRLFLFFYL